MSLVSSTSSATGTSLDVLHLDDADAADLELAGDGRRRRGDQPVAVAPDDRLVVADQREAAIEQAQRKVGFARARGPGDQHRAAVAGDGAGVDRFGRQPGRRLRLRSFAVRRRQADGEAGARWRVVAVLHVNLPVMAFDDRLGDRKAEARMAAEILRPPAVLSGSG